MNEIEKLAEYILKEMTKNPQAESIEISMKGAADIYKYLLGLSRIRKIAVSENGGAEYFT